MQRTEWLYSTGLDLGRDFGYTLLEFLVNAELLPLSRESILEAWTKLDSGAGWGTFSIRENGERSLLEFRDNFLEIPDPGGHTYCSFIAGYVHGVCWALIRAFPRLLKAAGHDTQATRVMIPDVIAERPNRAPCEFEITWRQETLGAATDRFFGILEALRGRDLPPIASEIRLVAETAFKTLLGVPFGDKLHLGPILWAAKQKASFKDSGLDFDGLGRMNVICNRSVHGEEPPLTRDEVRDFVAVLDNTLFVLEHLTLGRSVAGEVAAMAKEREERTGTVIVTGDHSPVVMDSHSVVVVGELSLSIEADLKRELARLDRILDRQPPSEEVARAAKISAEIQEAKRWQMEWLKEKLNTLSDVASGLAGAQELIKKIWTIVGPWFAPK